MVGAESTYGSEAEAALLSDIEAFHDEFVHAVRDRHVAAFASQQTREDLKRGLAAMREVVSALDRGAR